MHHRAATLCTALLLALTAGLACNTSHNQGTSSGEATPIVGAGSTFIYPIMMRWVDDFQGKHPGARINYQSIGSGAGIQQLKKGLIDFGASDAALDDQQLKEMPPVLQIPESAGPVCITYNLPDLKDPLKLSPSTVAGIFLGTIKNWQDGAVKRDNPGVKLPNQPVVVTHRSDASGTTNIFTTYLAKVSPEWEKKVGKGIAVSWPTGLGGKGNEGVTGAVKQTPGAIGYVELAYAKTNALAVALIRNAAGNWEAPSTEGTAAAIDAFHDELAKDVRTPIVDPPASAKDAYPICGLTFLLVPKDGSNTGKRELLQTFIQYVLATGQEDANALYYAKLPSGLDDQDQKLVASMEADGKPIQTNTSASLMK